MIAEVPSHFTLDLDYNASLRNAGSAIPVLKRLERYDNVAVFETPIPQEDLLGNQQICRAIDRPIAMHFGQPPYITNIREGACDGYVIGGGKSTVMHQGTLSAEARMPFWLQLVGNGLTTTWAAHLGAVLSHATWPTISCINLYTHHLLSEEIRVEGGYQQVPEGPGLGVEVDEEAVHQHLIPPEKLEPFAASGALFAHPKPRIINTVVYPDDTCVHMTGLNLGYYINGNAPVYVEGARVESWFDDGSAEWAELYERAGKYPVRGRWQGRGT